MVLLSPALEVSYRHLWKTFGARSFSRAEALDSLQEARVGLEKAAFNKIVHELENLGALETDWGGSPLDKRKSMYRLTSPEDLEKASLLSEEFLQSLPQEKPLSEILDDLWKHITETLSEKLDFPFFPESLSRLIRNAAQGECSRRNLSIIDKVNLSHLPKEEAKIFIDILKLFDASGNYYRSVSNVLLEYEKMKRWLKEGEFNLAVSQYIKVDGAPVKESQIVENSKVCPVCLTFPQGIQAQAMITGEPKTDSRYQLYRGSRAQMRICHWCFIAGYVDLPLSTIRKAGQAITKRKEYLHIDSSLSRGELQRLIDLSQGKPHAEIAAEEEAEPLEEDPLISDLTDEEKRRIRDFSVLGAGRGLTRLDGFVLPLEFDFSRKIGIAFPPGQLIALEEEASGFVKKKLVAATLYDLHKLTRGSVHYGKIGTGLLSMFGKQINVEEARQANLIFQICDKNRENFVFPVGVFELFFAHPREAVNGILRINMRREARFRPRSEKIEEVLKMAREIADQDDWIFRLGWELVEYLLDNGLIQWATSFHKSGGDTWSGVDLVKWIHNFKMVRDRDSLREWCTRVVYALKKEDRAYQANIQELVNLENKIGQECENHKLGLGEFSRRIANMDLYLLFSYTHDPDKAKRHNQRIEEAKKRKETASPAVRS